MSQKNKVQYLEKYVQQAKKEYQDGMESYVKFLVHKRWAALIEFFDKVDRLLQTISPQNIQFQTAEGLTNQQLTKLIHKYTLEKMENGLYEEYKRIRRGLSEEEGLIPQIWSMFREYLTTKYKHIESLVKQCYKSQTLPFTTEQLTEKYTTVEDRYNDKQKKKKTLKKRKKENTREMIKMIQNFIHRLRESQ